MLEVVDTLAYPAHLIALPGSRSKMRAPRWKKIKAVRPEGKKWEDADRWEITVPGGGAEKTALDWGGEGALAPGRRYVWVIPGRTWTEVRDGEGYIKVPTGEWNQIARTGRQVTL